MANDKSAAPKSYDRAREMAEKALEAFSDGDEKGGANLVERAKDLREVAIRDIHEELEEVAASEHDPKKLNQSIAKEIQAGKDDAGDKNEEDCHRRLSGRADGGDRVMAIAQVSAADRTFPPQGSRRGGEVVLGPARDRTSGISAGLPVPPAEGGGPHAG